MHKSFCLGQPCLTQSDNIDAVTLPSFAKAIGNGIPTYTSDNL